ncbi:lipid scramblase CLPTM1L [Oratosquilla oratoria]|uniref:lipid scramblase CLPTM1L n=1 Tax=Oratosquilla oratoria TaxID=337810 RepID=UPI003F75C1A1
MVAGLQFPSFSTLVCGLFTAYILHSVWTLAQLFMPPNCSEDIPCIYPALANNPKLQLIVYTSVKRMPDHASDLTLVHRIRDFDYHEPQESVVHLTLPKRVRKNGTLLLHFFMTSPYVDPENWIELKSNEWTIYAMTPFTQHVVPQPQTFSLLGEEENSKIEETAGSASLDKPVSHYKSQVAFSLLTELVGLPKNAMPYEIGRSLRLTSRGLYLPVIYVDEMSSRIRDLVKVEASSVKVNFTLKYETISYGKYRLWSQFEAAFVTMEGLGFTAKDLDEVKGIFTDTNLYLLVGTFLVAAVHLLFDFLAFKNDISFWQGRDDMTGISSSTVAWRAFSQIIIVLYLVDEQTSMLVLGPAAVGAIIELWKVTKAFHVEMKGWQIIIGTDLSREESSTRELDAEGIRYLRYLLYPLCFAGAVYSLLFVPHRSWYSWILTCLVNGVYAFGFLFMLPQLFINYKLKSVAHLPWRAFMYKAFNTFIDDLFAFIITMPTAHRVACFRDDVVFLIYLYQRWLYPVDKSRINEFGERGEDENKKND